jgi:hypothetical protein
MSSDGSQVDGVFIAKGTRVVVPTIALNQSRHLWGDDARDFLSKRWMGGISARAQ